MKEKLIVGFLRRVLNTTRRRLKLGPDRKEGYPLLATRKPAPTMAIRRQQWSELEARRSLFQLHNCLAEGGDGFTRVRTHS